MSAGQVIVAGTRWNDKKGAPGWCAFLLSAASRFDRSVSLRVHFLAILVQRGGEPVMAVWVLHLAGQHETEACRVSVIALYRVFIGCDVGAIDGGACIRAA